MANLKLPHRRQFLHLAAGAAGLAFAPHVARAQAYPTRPVRIAHQVDFMPIADFKDGQSVGLGVEIVRALAERSRIDAEFVPVPFEQVQKTLDDGRAVAIFPLAITAERQRLFDFSAPIYEGGGGLFVRVPEATPKDLASLFGRTVVTPRTGPLAGLIERAAPNVNLVVTADYEESLARLVRGDADAAALNFHVGAMLAARLYPGKVTMPRIFFTQNPTAIGVRKGEQAELLNRMSAGLAAIRADGTWQKINDRWINP